MKRLLTILMLLSASALATVTSGTTRGSCSSSTGLTLTISVSAGSLVVANGIVGTTSLFPVISDSASQTYTSVAAGVQDSNQGVSGQQFYVANSATLTGVTMKTSSASSFTCQLTVVVVSNALTASPLDIGNDQDNSTASTTCNTPAVTRTNASDVVIAMCANQTASTWSTGGTGGWTYNNAQSSGATAPEFLVEYATTTATGSTQGTMGQTASVRSIGFIAAFKLQAGGTTPTPTLPLMGVGD